MPNRAFSYRSEGGRPVPGGAHAGDCRMAGSPPRPATGGGARRALADGHGTHCRIRRSDIELGIRD